MTEFETATLAARDAALWVAIAQVAAALAIGAGQIAVVWYGIRAMRRMGRTRAREQDQRHEEAMAASRERHEEAMAALAGQRRALEALIEDQGESREALRETIASHEESRGESREAFRALIERAAPGAAR